MKKILFAMMLCAAVVACKKEEAAAPVEATPAEAAPAVEAAVPAEAAPAPGETTTAAALPAACEEYFKRAEACFSKAGAGGEAMKAGFEQSRTQMASVPGAQMEMGCKAANDAFAQTAAALKCE